MAVEKKPKSFAQADRAGTSPGRPIAHLEAGYKRRPVVLAPELAQANLYDPVLLQLHSQKALNFANFLPHSGNQEAIQYAKRLAVGGPGLRLGLVCFHAGSALGKSHLLQAIGVSASKPRVVLTSAADLEAEVEHAIRLQQQAELRRWLGQLDILLLDDIQNAHWDSRETQLAVTMVLNTVEQRGGVVALASRVPPEALRSLPSPLRSRLNAGLVVELFPPSHDERLRLLSYWFGTAPTEPETLELIGRTYPNDLRRMRAAVFGALTAHEMGRSKVVDVECVRRSFTKLKSAGPQLRTNIEAPGEMPPDTPVVDIALPAAHATAAAKAPDLDTPHSTPGPPPPLAETARGGPKAEYKMDSAQRFKSMVVEATTSEDLIIALQLALESRLSQMLSTGADEVHVRRLKRALSLLREGNHREALQWL